MTREMQVKATMRSPHTCWGGYYQQVAGTGEAVEREKTELC